MAQQNYIAAKVLEVICYDAFDIDVSCATCVNPQADFTTVSDCENGQQFLIDVDLTDLGSATDVIITDNQGNPSQTESSTGTYTFGPYNTGTPVIINIENGQDSSCSISSDNLIEEYCSEVAVDCSAGPVNSVICYEAGETVEVTYTGNDSDEVLNLQVNSAIVSTFGNGLTIYDSDGTTVLYQGTGDNGDLSGINVQSSGNQISIVYQGSAVYGCGEFGYTALDISVSCATCTSPEAAFTTVSDCENGEQFLIDVDLADLGSATDVDISDDQGNPVQTVSSTGIYSFGPYDINVPVTISIQNNQDPNCGISSDSLMEEYCPEVLVNCDAEPVDNVFCYDANELVEATYTSSNPDAILNFTVNSGMIFPAGGNFVIYDSDGTTELYNGIGDNGDLAGIYFQSSGDEVSFSYEAGAWACGDLNFTALDISVACSDCVNPEADFSVVSDCDSGTDQFFIDVDITDMGTATSLIVSDNQGSDTETANSTGIITFGPYPNSTEVVMTVENNEDASCQITSSSLTQHDCAPENNNCEDATVVDVNDGYECTTTTPGTLAGATPSAVDDSCGEENANDTWFEFTAIAETHVVSLLNVEDFFNTRFAIYEGDECSNLSSIQCGGPAINTLTIHDLTIGDTYYIRVFTDNNDTTTNFDVCITTPVQPIETDTEIYTVEELITEVLINDPCAQVSNVTYSTGTDYGDVNGIGYFTDNGSEFTFDSGLIMSTGAVDNAPGPRRPGSDGTLSWAGDPDLDELMQEIEGNYTTQSYNASVIEFDFIPFTDHISFEYLFASEEYGSFQCEFSDTFAFFLTDQDGNTTNMAVVPNTDTPVSVTTIRDNAHNGECSSENPEYFDSYYDDGNGLPEMSNPINFAGYTVTLTAEANVVPGQTYHIKLVIADRNDESYDSAVFLLANSFDLGALDLGEDLTVENGNAPCEEGSITLDSQLPETDSDITWYRNNELIEGENGTTLEVTESGEYMILVLYGGSCVLTDEVLVEFAPLPKFDFEDEIYSLCGSASVILDATPSNAADLDELTYIWMDADGEEIPGENGPTYETDQAGFITVEVTTEYGCSGSHTFEVVDGEFTIDLGDDQILCDLDSFDLTAEVIGLDSSDASYEWEGPDGTLDQTGQTISVSDSGIYTVYITIGDCTGEKSVSIDFNESPVFDLGNDIATGDLEGIVLDATPTNTDPDTATYEWNYNGNPIPEDGPIVNPTDYGYGTYTVTIYGDDPACDATQSITITEQEIICNVTIDADHQVVNTLQYCEDEGIPSYEITFNATFDIENGSGEEVEYTWFKNEEEIANATGNTYTVTYDE